MNISNSGGALGKSLFLKNVMGLWIIQQCKRSWNRSEPELNYEELVVRANLAKPLVAFIDPDDDSFFSPKDMPKAVCDFIQKTGQTIDANDIGQIARIVYESLALKYRLVLERICDVSSKKLDALHITGGGSKNALLNQLTANAMGVPVVAGPAEGTAMGNLLVQAYGCGALSGLDQIREVVNCSSDIMRFEPNDTSQWQTAYQKFREICK